MSDDSPIIKAELRQLLELIAEKEEELRRPLSPQEKEQFVGTFILNNSEILREEAITEVNMLSLRQKLKDRAKSTPL